jgi:phage tail-like protein
MAIFSVNSSRFDPYKNFKFLIIFDGTQPVAAVQKVSGLKKTTEMIEWREGGHSSIVRRKPGRTSYAAITAEQGVTHDTTFEDWANLVNKYSGLKGAKDEIKLGGEVSNKSYRKDIKIQVLNEQGQVALSYKVHRAWVSEYQAHGDLDANGKAVLITSVKIEHEGFERDTSVKEPKEV